MKHLLPVGVFLLAFAAPVIADDDDGVDLGDVVPAEADVVIVIDAGDILDSPVLKKYVPQVVAKHGYAVLEQTANTDQEKKAFAERREELQKILTDKDEGLKLLALLGGAVDQLVLAGQMADPKQGLFAVTGDWDQETAEGLLTVAGLVQPDSVRIVKEKGRKVFVIKTDDGGTLYCGAPDDGVIVFAPSGQAIHDAFDRLDDKKPGASKAVQAFLDDIDDEKNTDAIHVFADNAAEGLRARGGVTIDDDVEASLAVEAKDADRLDAIDKGFDAGLAQAREALDKADEPAAKVLARVLKSVTKQRDGKAIRVKAKLSADDLDALVKAAEKDGK